MKRLYRGLVPEFVRRTIKDRETYREYENLRKTPKHTYYRFDETKSIFIHIPKAGGISIIKSLYGEEANGFGHPTYERFLRMYGKRRYESYFKFTFVRNPWDRLLSAYNFLKNGGMNHLDKQFSDDVLKNYDSFESFVMEGMNEANIETWTHFIPQYRYIYDAQMNLVVDYVGRFEHFEFDFEHIRSVLQQGSSLQHRNKTGESKEENYRAAYTPEMIQKVAELYQNDIRMFGYEF